MQQTGQTIKQHQPVWDYKTTAQV